MRRRLPIGQSISATSRAWRIPLKRRRAVEEAAEKSILSTALRTRFPSESAPQEPVTRAESRLERSRVQEPAAERAARVAAPAAVAPACRSSQSPSISPAAEERESEEAQARSRRPAERRAAPADYWDPSRRILPSA